MKIKRRFRTIEELWDLEEKYPCVVGASLASMGAAVNANSKLQKPAVRNGNGTLKSRGSRKRAARA